MNKHNCRVCGLYIDEFPWGENGNCPTYEICPCCGVEFGNEDYTIKSVKKYRDNWVKKGTVWFEPDQKPKDWSLKDQQKNIPKEFV